MKKTRMPDVLKRSPEGDENGAVANPTPEGTPETTTEGNGSGSEEDDDA